MKIDWDNVIATAIQTVVYNNTTHVFHVWYFRYNRYGHKIMITITIKNCNVCELSGPAKFDKQVV